METASVIERIIIKRNKKFDSLILAEIRKIATENGIDTIVNLNDKAIVSALEKQIPKKATPIKVEIDKIKIRNVNWGKNTTVYKCPYCDDFISISNKFCHSCGQALDWSDSDE